MSSNEHKSCDFTPQLDKKSLLVIANSSTNSIAQQTRHLAFYA